MSLLTFLFGCGNKAKDNPSEQEEWRQKTLSYVESINAYIKKGNSEGWENTGPQPEDSGREHLIGSVIAAIRHANDDGDFRSLRESWPLAHVPFIPILEKEGQSIPVVFILDDGSIVARIGTNYQQGKTIHIQGDKATEVPSMGYFGRCPNRRYFGISGEKGISITDGWQGPEVAMCPWPNGTEDIPEGFDVKAWSEPPKPSRIIPFPDGKKVLMVSEQGIYVLTEHKAHRLLPTKEDMKEHFEWSKKEYPEDDLFLDLSMEHGAVSKDGKLIAVGSQGDSHMVFNSQYELIGRIGVQSEYPHYAAFSEDQSTILFNSCHFYNGISVGVPVSLLPGLETEDYKEDERTPILEDGARVYAAASKGDEIVIGDAGGYIKAVGLDGERRWEQFIGSSVGDIDISPDGKTLVVSTYAGFLSIFDLDSDGQAPYQIGDGGHFEKRRWIFWKSEKKPLIW
ncbi:hypothetical protein KFE80_12135 [bacterium SCSIO 12696]|nr:hypothetical protein KFE80_12135 [bacterium SCSIO 12696]